MTDIVDSQTRSRMMSGIRGKNTKPELALRRSLHALGFRYRLHAKGIPGKPDIVMPKYRAVIFVHGCFWHRHAGCRYATVPATRPEFWATKFDANVVRDVANVDFHPEVTRVFHRELTRLKVMFCGLCLGQDMRGLPFRFGYC